MAATDRRSRALLALTSAAMALPGIAPRAEQPVASAKGTVQYGHYEESDDRMQAQVFHAEATVPIGDRAQISFDADQDVYSGASPLYAVPSAMLAQPKRVLGTAIFEPADVITSASPVVGTFEVTTSMHGFRAFEQGFIDYILTTPIFDQTIAGGLAAGYAAVLNQLIPDGTPVVQTLVAHPEEARDEGRLAFDYFFDDVKVTLSGGASSEPDFRSTFGSVSASWELPDRQTTLTAGYSLTGNDITRVESHGGGEHVHTSDRDYPGLDADSTFQSVHAGIGRTMTRNTVLQVEGSYTHQDGYLSNPYKLVYIRGEITPEEYAALNLQQAIFQEVTDLEVAGVDLFREVRPRERNQVTVGAQLRQHVPAADASVHLDYRYYSDDWDIDAHTVEFSWHQALPFALTVSPYARYYTQTAAFFHAPYYLAPRADGYYSSDYRLGDYGALAGGVTVRKELARGLSLQGGFEYYTQQEALQWGDAENHGGYADFDSYLAHASLEIDMDATLSKLGDGDHAHQHGSHGSHTAPAGLMQADMMTIAGELMVGYQHMYASLDGQMSRGTNTAQDAEVLASACAPNACTTVPKDMDMHMHMFHVMVAPTEWLNLSVMPMLVNMDMEMRTLDGAVGSDVHAHPHSAYGLGDTELAAVVRLFGGEHHHLHAGLALSAPTGSIDKTLDGTEEQDSVRQSYDMQTGSGTWDLGPSLTYRGEASQWLWGAQVRGTVRLEDHNEQGYRLGDLLQVSPWTGVRFSPWLSATLRGIYTRQGEIEIERPPKRANSQVTPADFPDNYGGVFWDLGLGLNFTVPGGALAGHGFGVEWTTPVHADYNGYQFERESALTANWRYHF